MRNLIREVHPSQASERLLGAVRSVSPTGSETKSQRIISLKSNSTSRDDETPDLTTEPLRMLGFAIALVEVHDIESAEIPAGSSETSTLIILQEEQA